MPERGPCWRWLVLALLLALVLAASWTAQGRLSIMADLSAYLPASDQALASGQRILAEHPSLDLVAVDLSLAPGPAQPALLARAGDLVQARLQACGLCGSVGLAWVNQALPEIYALVLGHLPELFSPEELLAQVAPRLGEERMAELLQAQAMRLRQLGGLGQGQALAQDPLMLRELALARLASALPGGQASLQRGHLFSADQGRLLLLAEPQGPGRDTHLGRPLAALLDQLSHEVGQLRAPDGRAVQMAYTGAFRFTLDNEEIIRGDTELVLSLCTLVIALLLLACFPRPWIGILALAPSLAGAAVGLFVYSLLRPGISGLALGFGGAVIAIGVDSGIAYLMFLDRVKEVSARQIIRQALSVELFTTLTTVNVFAAMLFSDFMVMQEVGLFAALGVGFSLVFSYTFFPLLFPRLNAARRGPLLGLDRLAQRLTQRRGWAAALAILLLGLGLATVSRPQYQADIRAMSTVSPSTRAAEQTIRGAWGDIMGRGYLMLRAADPAALLAKAGDLARFLDQETARGGLQPQAQAFRLLPGPREQAANLDAWRRFWQQGPGQGVGDTLARAGARLGFAPTAFAPFLQAIGQDQAAPLSPSPEVLRLVGAAPSRQARGGWLLLVPLSPGQHYQPAELGARALAQGFYFFDSQEYARRLSELFSDTFQRLLAMMGLCLALLLGLLFLDWGLLAAALTPLVFSLMATLGTLKLLGRPLDISGLMLAVIVLGLGTDYAVYLVRARQRYLTPDHPDARPFHTAAFLAASATALGVGALALARHAVLKSSGVCIFLALGYNLIATFGLLPPLLDWLFRPRPWPEAPAEPSRRRLGRLVLGRYQHLYAWVRLSAGWRLWRDALFPELDGLLLPSDRRVLLLGCGVGLEGTWLAARHARLELLGLEADPHRARLTARAWGRRGQVHCAGPAQWPALLPGQGGYDLALLLDEHHYLSQAELAGLLAALRAGLAQGGRLLLRAPARAGVDGPGRRLWRAAWLAWQGREHHPRTAAGLAQALAGAGFRVEQDGPGPGQEGQVWLKATA